MHFNSQGPQQQFVLGSSSQLPLLSDSLKFTSALSVALAVVFVVIMAGIVIVKLFIGTVKAPRLLPVHSIYNELEDPSEMQPIVRTSLALCSIVYINSLKFTFALSAALVVVFVVIMVGIVIVKLFSGTVKAPRLLPDIVDFTSFLKLFTVVPVSVTAYISHYNVHSIYNELEDPSEMQPIVRTSLELCSIVYTNSLKFTSALSVALVVVFVVITAGIAIVKLFSGIVKAPRLLPDIVDFTSFLKLFTVVPVIVTAYICHYNVHSIYNELEDPLEMQPIVRTSLALCSIVYISTSFFGFLLFGDQTMDDVLANFDTNLGFPYSVVLNDIVHVTYVVHLMLVFPLIFFSLRLNLDGLVFPAKKHLVLDNKRFTLITAGLIGIVFLGASFIPSIWDAFQFTGATTTVCIGFIFPASIALR
eukprot:PITA_15256